MCGKAVCSFPQQSELEARCEKEGIRVSGILDISKNKTAGATTTKSPLD